LLSPIVRMVAMRIHWRFEIKLDGPAKRWRPYGQIMQTVFITHLRRFFYIILCDSLQSRQATQTVNKMTIETRIWFPGIGRFSLSWGEFMIILMMLEQFDNQSDQI
jgi:hypothetical protein